MLSDHKWMYLLVSKISAMDFDNVLFNSIFFFLIVFFFFFPFEKVGFIVMTVKACYFCQRTYGEGKRKNGTKAVMEVENT